MAHKTNPLADWLNQGETLIQNQDYHSALQVLQGVTRLDQTHAQAYYLTGLALSRLSEFHQAISLLSNAILFDPQHIAALLERAAAYLKLGDFEAAIEDANRVISLNEYTREAYTLRSAAYQAQGDLHEALADLGSTLRIDPNYQPALRVRALLKSRTGDMDGSIADLNQALELYPQDAEAYFLRASLRFTLGDYYDAAADYQQLLRLKPDHVTGIEMCGMAYLRFGQFEKAFQMFGQALALVRHDAATCARIHAQMAEAHVLGGDFPQALSALDEAVHWQPTHEYLVRRAEIREQIDDLGGAIDDYEQALQLAGDPDSFQDKLRDLYHRHAEQADANLPDMYLPEEAHNLLARARQRAAKGHLTTALADLNAALTHAPQCASLYLNRAAIQRRTGQVEEALTDLNRALQLDSSRVAAYIARGDLLTGSGRYEEAWADFNQALTLNPDSAEAYGLRGNLFTVMGRIDDALTDLYRAIERHPHNPHFWLGRGLARIADNNLVGAMGDLDEAIHLDPQLVDAHYYRAKVGLLRQDDPPFVIADYTRALELKPDHAFAPVMRAQLARLNSPYPGELNPLDTNQRILLEQSRRYLAAGDFKQALRAADNLVRLAPKNAAIVTYRADVRRQSGYVKDAVTDYTAVLQQDSLWLDAWYGRGLSYHRLNKPREAGIDLQMFLDLHGEELSAQMAREARQLLNTLQRKKSA